MQKIQIAPQLRLYRFPPEDNQAYGFNLYTLYNGRDVLLIDTGYPQHASRVLDELAAEGRRLQVVLLSHFHDDHLLGLSVLPEASLWGSEHYRQTLSLYPPAEDLSPFVPDRSLRDEDEVAFGQHQLRFLAAPGHSACGLFVVIDERWVHIGDSLMATNDGWPLCPWAAYEDVSDFIATLEKLRRFQNAVLLPGHGPVIQGREQILERIENALAYLRAVQDNQGRASFAEANAGCSIPFTQENWHITAAGSPYE